MLPGQYYTWSIYLKKGPGYHAPDWMTLSTQFQYSNVGYVNFNLTTGAYITYNGATATMTSVGNGWYRCTMTFVCAAFSTFNGTQMNCWVAFNNNSSATGRLPAYTGTPMSDVLLWGHQLELGTAATDYVPTNSTGAPVLSAGFAIRVDPTGFATIGSLDEVSINPRSNTSTNIFSYSTDLTNAYWTNYNDISYANAAIAPDGTNTAFLMMSQGSYPNNRPSSNITVQPYTYYTLSAYVKYGNTAQCTIGNEIGSSAIASFDLTNGTNTNLAYNASNPIIRSVGNGWYRISIVIYTASYSYMDPEPFRVGAFTSQPTGAYMYCWGPQLELGIVATDYVPTGASATPITQFVERKASTGLHRISGAYDEVSLNPNSGYTKNFLPWSQDFSQTSAWSYASNGVALPPALISNNNMAPDGTMTAAAVYFSSLNGGGSTLSNGGISQPVIGTTRTFSVWLKCVSDITYGNYTYITLFNGDQINGSGLLVTNQWQRFSTSGVTTASNAFGIRIVKRDIWGTAGNATILIWGAQWELGPAATDYVPTGVNAIPLT